MQCALLHIVHTEIQDAKRSFVFPIIQNQLMSIQTNRFALLLYCSHTATSVKCNTPNAIDFCD